MNPLTDGYPCNPQLISARVGLDRICVAQLLISYCGGSSKMLVFASLASVVSDARSVSSAGVEHFPCGNEGYDPDAPTQVLSVLPSMLYPQSLPFHVDDRHDRHQHCFSRRPRPTFSRCEVKSFSAADDGVLPPYLPAGLPPHRIPWGLPPKPES